MIPLATPIQLTPKALYNGVDRPLLVNVSPNRVALRLLEGGSGKEIARTAGTVQGTVDLARAIPGFWKLRPARAAYLQAYGGGTPKASALVFQPLTNPAVATLDPATKAPRMAPDEDQAFAGYRVYRDARVAIVTEGFGEMLFRLRPDAAPNTAFNFRSLVEGGFYEATIVHRIVAKGRGGEPFVIQGGDPTGTGSGGPGYAIPFEDSPLPHDFGVLSMARSTDPNTAGAQWFVALSRAGTARLDRKYASFGELVGGAEALRKIAALAVGKDDRPFRPPVTSLRLVPAPPYPDELRAEIPKG